MFGFIEALRVMTERSPDLKAAFEAVLVARYGGVEEWVEKIAAASGSEAQQALTQEWMGGFAARSPVEYDRVCQAAFDAR